MIKFKIIQNNNFELSNDVKKNHYKLYEFDNILFKIRDKSYYYYIVQINYKYEFLKQHIIHNDNYYKTTFDFFELNNEKYHFMNTTKDNKKIVS